MQAKLRCREVTIGQDAALVISAPDASLQRLDLQRGALVIDAPAGARITVDGLVVDNEGWAWEALQRDERASEEERIR